MNRDGGLEEEKRNGELGIGMREDDWEGKRREEKEGRSEEGKSIV